MFQMDIARVLKDDMELAVTDVLIPQKYASIVIVNLQISHGKYTLF